MLYCVPHVCGGDPIMDLKDRLTDCVFPMYVGVILFQVDVHVSIYRVPHVCGGDPVL